MRSRDLFRKRKNRRAARGGALLFLLAILMLCTGRIAHAQEEEEKSGLVTVSGTATLTGDIYDFSSTGAVPTTPRRPPSLFRFILTPTVTIGEEVSLPFTIMFSSRETSTITPPIRDASPSQFLLNQANSFGVSPKIGWAQTHLGSHTPRFSELSLGDVQLFGLGFDLKPGNFRVAASAGIAQRAVEADTAAMTRGAYARHLYAGTVGYMAGESEFALTVLRARDDPASIRTLSSSLVVAPDSTDPSYRDTIHTRHPLMPLPEEGFVTTISARFPVVEGGTIAAEVGGGLFTRDMLADDIGEKAEALNAVMRQRISTRADGAGKITATYTRDEWGISLTGLYIGPGYVTLGYPYLESDRLEITVAPVVRLFENKLGIAGTFGHRTNNLTETKGATTRQILAAANVDAQLTGELTLAAGYTNFGITTDVTNDTFKVRSIAQSFNVTPTYTLPGDDLTHTITASYALDDYDDLNPITGAESSNRTQTLMGTYIAAFSVIPLTFDLTGSYLTNDLPTGDLVVQSATAGLGYRLLKGDITPALSVSYTRTLPGPATADTQLGVRLSTTWRITSRLRLMVSASTSGYNYGSSHAGGSFRENLLRTSLSWRL